MWTVSLHTFQVPFIGPEAIRLAASSVRDKCSTNTGMLIGSIVSFKVVCLEYSPVLAALDCSIQEESDGHTMAEKAKKASLSSS